MQLAWRAFDELSVQDHALAVAITGRKCQNMVAASNVGFEIVRATVLEHLYEILEVIVIAKRSADVVGGGQNVVSTKDLPHRSLVICDGIDDII